MPPTLTSPGVYVTEIPSGVRTISGVATSIAAFVGRAPRGAVDAPRLLHSWADFEREFGGLWSAATLGYAVRDFYRNGGRDALILRLFEPGDGGDGIAQIAIGNRVTLRASSPGQWGAKLRVTLDHEQIADDPAHIDLFNLRISEAVPNGRAERIRNVSLVGTSVRRIDLVLEHESALIRWAGNAPAEAAGTARPADGADPAATADADAAAKGADLATAQKAGKSAATDLTDAQRAVAGAAADVTAAKAAETAAQKAVDDAGPNPPQDLVDALDAAKAKATAADTAKTAADAAEAAAKAAVDAAKATTKSAETAMAAAVKAVATAETATGAGDGAALDASAFDGSGQGPGLAALDLADLFNILCIPPHEPGGDIEPDLVATATAYCEQRRAMFLIDPPANWTTAAAAVAGYAAVPDEIGARSRNAALFFPRLVEADPLKDGQPSEQVPCGAMAGVFARTDADRGVWKAPAGVDAAVRGAAGLTVPLTDAENGDLNQLGLNCIRNFPIYQRVVWGSRTMRGADRLADEWKYIPVRRTALYIEESLSRGTQWVVFEPNDEPLWAQIRLSVGAFMQSLFRQGAFKGRTPKDAYFVKCDAETTTQNDIDLGIVNIHVGFAPLKPAEFVVLVFQQIAGNIQS